MTPGTMWVLWVRMKTHEEVPFLFIARKTAVVGYEQMKKDENIVTAGQLIRVTDGDIIPTPHESRWVEEVV